MSTTTLVRKTPASTVWDEDDDLETTSPLDAVSPIPQSTEVEQEEQHRVFEELADELAAATRGLSSTRLATGHPAYSEILALGEPSIPWLLERLKLPESRPIWLRLLGSITRFEPGAGMETVPDAAVAWITWGKMRQAR